MIMDPQFAGFLILVGVLVIGVGASMIWGWPVGVLIAGAAMVCTGAMGLS
jgi:hypothetical protein